MVKTNDRAGNITEQNRIKRTLALDPDKALMTVMRIHAYGGPEQLHYESVPIPQIDKDQVLVRIYAASVNPIDCKLASGAVRPVMNNKAVALPWIPGGDFCGIIEASGKNAADFKKGDIVYGNCPAGGAYAQFVAANVKTIALKPQSLNFVEAAAVPLAAQTAWQALFEHGHLQSGQSVLIHGGAGGVGSFAIQLACYKNAKVSATGSENHIDYLRELGAQQVIDYQKTPFETTVKGVDLVIDLVGGEVQERSFQVIKPGGYLVSAINPPSEELSRKYNVNSIMMTMKPSTQQLNQLTELLDGGLIKVNISNTYLLSQAKEAWRDILSHHTKGKIVLKV